MSCVTWNDENHRVRALLEGTEQKRPDLTAAGIVQPCEQHIDVSKQQTATNGPLRADRVNVLQQRVSAQAEEAAVNRQPFELPLDTIDKIHADARCDRSSIAETL